MCQWATGTFEHPLNTAFKLNRLEDKHNEITRHRPPATHKRTNRITCHRSIEANRNHVFYCAPAIDGLLQSIERKKSKRSESLETATLLPNDLFCALISTPTGNGCWVLAYCLPACLPLWHRKWEIFFNEHILYTINCRSTKKTCATKKKMWSIFFCLRTSCCCCCLFVLTLVLGKMWISGICMSAFDSCYKVR